jgi:aspartyl-tRNA(Asn)/glutamyl-tRNA(Gln) amidotransferase subunit A
LLLNTKGYVFNMNRRELMMASAIAAIYTATTKSIPAFAQTATSSEELTALTLSEASRRIRSKQVTSTELTKAVLARISIYNPKLNAFITVMTDDALAQADELDKEAKAGKFRGPLHGIPIALKDNIDTANARTTAASQVFDDRFPTEDATVVALLKSAGAVVIGKTNLHEFAMGGSSASTYFGPVRNPWALDHIPAGSSGGSAAAVSSEMAFGALGTDTGGSVRMPAAYCSIVGLKPTYGLVSIHGIVPLVYSLDHCGPMTRTVEDAAIMLNAMVGYDKQDVASVEHAKEDYVSEIRLGIPRAPFFDHLDPDTAKAIEEAIAVLTKLTKSTKTVHLPPTTNAGTAAIRAEIEAYHQELFRNNPQGYSMQVRRTIGEMQKQLNDESSEACSSKVADYIEANWKLILTRKTIDDAFADFDLVAMPTMRIVARTINDQLSREEDPKPIEPEIISNCSAFNIFGLPAISIPCGFSSNGLPIGLMIAGPRFSEGKVLALANAYEKATQWHTKKPTLTPDTTVPPIVRKS